MLCTLGARGDLLLAGIGHLLPTSVARRLSGGKWLNSGKSRYRGPGPIFAHPLRVASVLSTSQLIADSHHAGIELQIKELEVAHSFLDSAETVFNPETVQRLHKRARAVRNDVVRFLAVLRPSEDQQARLNGLLSALEERLNGKRRNLPQ
jgi:hypothetical protein